MQKMRTFLRYGFGLALMALLSSPTALADGLNVAVADSTCDAMNKIGRLYAETHPIQPSFVCKSSGLLAKGLRGGALKADIFVSANREWMDFAIDNGLIEAGQVASPWGSSLVVAAAKANPLRFENWQDLASDKVATILIGDPGTAPFGRYTKQAMEASGIWERIKHKIETRKNISLLAESLAAADARTVGILFKTHLDGNLRELHAVNPSWHPPIRYYVAPLKASAGRPEVAGFLEFMRGRAASAVFLADGFDVNPR